MEAATATNIVPVVAPAPHKSRNGKSHMSNGNAELNVEMRILSSFRGIVQALDVHSRKLQSVSKMTTAQLVTLLYVVKCGPITASDLAQHVHLTSSTLVGVLDRLEAKGFVIRARGTVDRRQVFVTATPEGVERAELAPSPLQEKFASMLADLPEDERKVVASTLERVVSMMEV